MRITIAGMPGSGKSTAADFLARKFRLKRYGIGDLRRKMALERGMTLSELNRLGEKEMWTDKEMDEYQKKLAKEDNFVIDGRLSWFFIPSSIKIFFNVNPKTGAERIFMAARKSERKYENASEVEKANKERIRSDMKRYKKLYGINPYEMKNHDILIDTSGMSIDEMNHAAFEAVKRFLKGKNQKKCLKFITQSQQAVEYA